MSQTSILHHSAATARTSSPLRLRALLHALLEARRLIVNVQARGLLYDATSLWPLQFEIEHARRIIRRSERNIEGRNTNNVRNNYEHQTVNDNITSSLVRDVFFEEQFIDPETDGDLGVYGVGGNGNDGINGFGSGSPRTGISFHDPSLQRDDQRRGQRRGRRSLSPPPRSLRSSPHDSSVTPASREEHLHREDDAIARDFFEEAENCIETSTDDHELAQEEVSVTDEVMYNARSTNEDTSGNQDASTIRFTDMSNWSRQSNATRIERLSNNSTNGGNVSGMLEGFHVPRPAPFPRVPSNPPISFDELNEDYVVDCDAEEDKIRQFTVSELIEHNAAALQKRRRLLAEDIDWYDQKRKRALDKEYGL